MLVTNMPVIYENGSCWNNCDIVNIIYRNVILNKGNINNIVKSYRIEIELSEMFTKKI